MSILAKYKSFVTFSLIALVISLDYVVVTAAITSTLNLQSHYNITSSKASWALSSYAITFSSFIAFLGRVGDTIGNTRIFFFCTVGFSIVSLVCALPHVPYECFLVFRALQGVFGAGIVPSGFAIANMLYADSPKTSMVAFSVLSSVFSSSFGVGFLIGGAFSESDIGFKGVYYISFGITFLASILFFLVTDQRGDSYEQHIENLKSLDFIGCFMFVSGTALLVTGLTEGGEDWKRPSSYVCFLLGIVLLVVYFIWNFYATGSLGEKSEYLKHINSLIPKDILIIPSFLLLLVAELLNYCALFGHLLLVCYYLQYVEGYSPLSASLRLLPAVGGQLVGTITLSVYPNIFSPNTGCFFGFSLIFIGSLVFRLTISLHENVYWRSLFPIEVIMCIGSAFFFPISLNLLIGISPHEFKGLVSGIVQTFAQFGVAITFSVLTSVLGDIPDYNGERNDSLVEKFERSTNFVLACASVGLFLICWMVFSSFVQKRRTITTNEEKVSDSEEGQSV